MTEHHVNVQVRIVTDTPECCSQECPHYISSEYECRLFLPGNMLKASGSGYEFRLYRHDECLAATEGE